MNIDIDTTFKVILVLVIGATVTCLIVAFKAIRAGRGLEFYRKRQDLIEQGWRLIVFAILLTVAGLLFYKLGEPVAYRYFPPSPTITRTPTITTTPTITLTLQNTLTPTITQTLAQTYTPMIPDVVKTAIKTPVGVDVQAVFSPIEFSTQTKDSVVINTTNTFTLPITQMYGGYTFDKMVTGVQWSAVWLYEDSVICFETSEWNFAPGGSGYTDACNNKTPAVEWLPGEYEVQIFVGQTWKTSGRFTVLGNTPPEGLTPSATLTLNQPLPSRTPTLSVSQ